MNSILTNQLTKKYKQNIVVNNLELKVPEKAIYGFLGPNGAGKTTTIRMILGLINPTTGNVFIEGQESKKNRKQIMKNIGALVENPSLYTHLTGKENLKIPATILDIKKTRIEEVLQLVDLQDVQNKKVSTYSLGMKQRLGLAIGLLHMPRLIMLDEPTNGLDPQGIKEIRDLIKSLPQKYGITVFLSSHMLNEIELIATHVGIINKGKLLFQGELAELEKRQTEKLLLKVKEAKKTQNILSKHNIQTTAEEKGLIIVNKIQEQEIPKITKIVIDAGIDLYGVIPQKQSLENIFMNLTK